ncbi:sorbin and SH3 domain-containing protein 1-like isoform X2 [Pristis pectinata]|uniref:sorbin and SH3 domain-containing protein 1-like isoform X2 n=1 Tax=Pristis pectinata TaxID=685728 RepID=UPI00223DCC5C|nr:sorbin and SH3 domain-containing protein 1-like isoform X2 [Pristis pectinata]
MNSAWKPCPFDRKPQNSLAAKGFRSVRPKFLASVRKPTLQHSDLNVKDDITRAKDILSSDLPNQEAPLMGSQSNVSHANEAAKLSKTLNPNHSVPHGIGIENQKSSSTSMCKDQSNARMDNFAPSDDPREHSDTETDLEDKEVNSSDSEMDFDPVYKARLQSASQKMNTAIVLSATSAMTSEKRFSPLMTKKVPAKDGPKTWYNSILKDDHSIPKADNYGLSSNIDAKNIKWESNPKKQPSSSSATVNMSRLQLTEPVSYNPTTEDNYTIKWPYLFKPHQNSDNEKQNGSAQSQYPEPKTDRSGSNPLSANPCDSQIYTSSGDCQHTRPMEILSNSLSAKEFHSHFSTTANPEENNWSPANGKIDTSSYHVEPGNAFVYEPGKSAVSDYGLQKSRQNRTSGDTFLYKTRSLPAVETASSQLTSKDPVQHNGSGTDPDQCLEIRHDSTNLLSAHTENDANLSCQSQKQKLQEEIPDPKQQLKTGWLVRAKYDFHGQTSIELPVKKGDIIFIHRQRDDNWYEGKCNRKSGLLPICYVEPTSELQPHKDTIDEIAIAKFRFTALTNIELPLEKNQTVVLLRRIDENWYEGKYPGTNRKGIFPVTYVEVIGKPSDPICHQELTISASDLKIETASQRSLHQLHQRSVNYENIQHGEEIYSALYSFAPNKDDELELRQGDVVSVINKWDDGTSIRTKKFGTFPGNYVQKFESV